MPPFAADTTNAGSGPFVLIDTKSGVRTFAAIARQLRRTVGRRHSRELETWQYATPSHVWFEPEVQKFCTEAYAAFELLHSGPSL